ncbi:MAG: hypothetical protein ACK4GL_03100 [Flavobacteriales bacterium]
MQVKKHNLKARIKRRRYAVFAACLLLSTVFWFLNTSGNLYIAQLNVPVRYLNAGNIIIDEDELPKQVAITLNGTGYDILSFFLNPEKGTIVVDGNKVGIINRKNFQMGFILMQEGIEYFNRQHATIKAIDIHPDTIFVELKNKEFKKVPIKVNLDYSFHKQYGFMKPLEITPDSIDISGDAEIISRIHHVETEIFSKHNIQSSFQKTLKLISIEGVNMNPSQIELNFSVEQFTEQLLEVPVKLKNLNGLDSLILIPNIVKVTFMIALHDFVRVQNSDFLVEADAAIALSNRRGTVDLELTKFPNYIRNPRITPEKAEYIIVKNRRQK